MKTITALFAIFLSGCSTMNLSPEQMKAMSESQSSVCFQGPGWNGGTVSLTYSTFGGKSTGTAGGGGTVECGAAKVTFTNDGKAPKAVQ